jgi:tRNA-dihydrouridine synthase A
MQGVMLGRQAMDNPWFFSDVDRRFFGKENVGLNRREILKIWGDYGDWVLKGDGKVNWSN